MSPRKPVGRRTLAVLGVLLWDAGLPAVLMTDGTKYDYYPWYHDPGDTLDKVNIPYLRSMIQLNAAATVLLTVAPES